jgi:hypothetical protein
VQSKSFLGYQVLYFLKANKGSIPIFLFNTSGSSLADYQFSAGGIIKLPKFDASMKKGEGSQKLSLGPEDVHIATMYD